ncbi:MAG: ABC transporter substrate-binding protein [Mycoplasmatales bacterium]
MKKILGLLTIAVLLLAGCGNSDSGVPTLRMSTWAGGEELAEMQAIIDEVNADNLDKFTIKLESIPSDYTMKLQTQLSSGSAPDLMWLSQENIQPFAELGAIVDIDAEFKASEIMSKYTFNQPVLDTATINDKVYGIPWISNPNIIYFNKDIVSAEDAARLEGTVNGEYISWEEYSQIAAKYNDIPAGNYGTLIDGWPPLELFIWAFGGDMQDAEGNMTINTPEVLNAVTFLNKIVAKEPITPNTSIISQAGYAETFQQGKTAMLIGGLSDRIELSGEERVPFTVGYAVAPKEAVAATYNWNASTVISKDSKNKDLAYQAMEQLSVKFWNWKPVPPVDITQLGYENYDDYCAQNLPAKEGIGAAALESMNISRTAAFTSETARIQTALYEEIYTPILNSAVTGVAVDPQTLIDNAVKKVENK